MEDFTEHIQKLEALITITSGPDQALLKASADALRLAQDEVDKALDERDDARETLSKIRPRLDVLEAERTEAVSLMKHMVHARSQEKRAEIRKSARRLITKSELNEMQWTIKDVLAGLHSEEARKDKAIDAFLKSVEKASAPHPDDDQPVPSVAKAIHDLAVANGEAEPHDQLLNDDKLQRPRPLFTKTKIK